MTYSDIKVSNQTRYSSEDILKLFAWFDEWTTRSFLSHAGIDPRSLSDFWARSAMQQLKISYLGSRHISESDVNMSYPTLPGFFPGSSRLKAHLSITSPARLLSRQDPLRVLALSRNGQADYLDEETCREILRWYFSEGQLLNPKGFSSNWQGRKDAGEEIINHFEELAVKPGLGPINDVGTVRNTARHKWPVVWNAVLSEWGKDMPSVKISNGIEHPPRKRSLEERVAHCREQFGDSSGVMSGGSKNPNRHWESRIKWAAWKYQQEWERQEKWRQKLLKHGAKAEPHLSFPEYLRYVADQFEANPDKDWTEWWNLRGLDLRTRKENCKKEPEARYHSKMNKFIAGMGTP